MTVQPIRLFGDPVLRTPADPVVDFDRELRRLVDDLTETMRDQSGLGLAAPQEVFMVEPIAQGAQARAIKVADRDPLPTLARADQRGVAQLQAALFVEEVWDRLGPPLLLLDRALGEIGCADELVVRGRAAHH